MNQFSETVKESAVGRWGDIFEALGVAVPASPNKHGPCPICQEGKDRFRMDDKNGSGSWICSRCDSAGDGFSLLMKCFDWKFTQALEYVAGYLGLSKSSHTPLPVSKPKEPEKPVFDVKKHQKIGDTLAGSQRIGWPMAKYFANRGLNNLAGQVPICLRLHPGLPYWQETKPGQWEKSGVYPAILGVVTDPAGEIVTLHRTYITQYGEKAPFPNPKKLMSPALPGSLKGCSIKLGTPTDTLYLTEGIETALAVMLSTGEAVWACISAKLLEGVVIPDSVKEVNIMGDLDRSKAGEKSARKLAQRLLRENSSLTVRICLPPGEIPEGQKSLDWMDIYKEVEA